MAQEELKIAGMKLKIDGAAQFQSDLSLCTKASATLKLDLKLLEAQTTSTGKNGTEYLSAKSQNLTKQIAEQQQKTKLLNETLAELKNNADVDAKQVKKLEDAIYKSQVETAQMTRALNDNNAALAKSENSSLKAANQMKDLGDKAKVTGDKLASAGQSATMYLTVPIAAAGVAAVKFASDYEESLNKVDVAFKDDAAEVIAWSNTTLAKFGLAKGTSLDMAATYGDMATGMGFTTDAAAKMGKEIVGRAADMSSFKNVSIDIANTGMTAIFTGETESLKKLGVIMTEANLKQYMLSNGYTKTYEELTQAEKVTLRYQFAMNATKNSAGDFANTVDGTANQSRLFTESLKELSITFGEDLLPIITPVIKGANSLIQTFGDMDKGQRSIIIGIGLVVSAVGPALLVIGKGVSIYGALTGAMAANAIAQEMKNAKEAEGAITAAANTAAEATKTGVIVTETVATEGLEVAEGAATVAGAGLAAVLGPIALVVGAVAAGYYVLNNRIGESTKAATEAEKSYKASSDEYENSTSKMQTNANMAKTLGDQLYKLADSENKTNEQKQHMTKLVAQLNQLEPTLNLAIDAQTGALNKTKKSLDDLVESELADCKAQAERNRLTQLYSEELQITEDLTTAKAKLLEEQKKGTLQNLEDQAAWIKAGNSWATFVTGADDAKATIAKLTEDQKVNAKQTSDLTNQMTGLTVATNAQTTANQTASTESTTSTQATQTNTTATEAHVVMLTKDALVINAAAKATRDAAQASKEAAASIAGDMELVSTVFVGGTYTVEEWRDKTIAAAGGVQAAILKAKAAYASSGGASLQHSGEYSTSGLITGMLDNNKGVADAATKLADTAANAYNKSMEINSPSRRMGRAAGFTVDGLIEQFKAKEPELAAASLRLADLSAKNMVVKPAVSLSAGAANAGLSSASVASSSASIDYAKLGATVAAAMPKSDFTGFAMQLDGRTVGRLIREAK